MVKKLIQKKKEKKKDGEFITRLLKQNESPIKIARKYGFSKQVVNYRKSLRKVAPPNDKFQRGGDFVEAKI